MNKQKIIIHIGLQKTASSYLQKIIFPHLKDIVYVGRPFTQENYAFNSLQYADKSIYQVSAFRDEIDSIVTRIAKGRPILISDELFSGYAHYNFINRGIIAERLAEAIPEAEIVLFLRGQIDLILSMYSQYVRSGRLTSHLDKSFLHQPGKGFSVEKWIEGERGWKNENRFIHHQSVCSTEHFRYSSLYSLYGKLFKKVHVFLYEDFKHNPNACLLRLASILTVDMPDELKQDSNTHKIIINKRLEKKQIISKLLRNRIAHITPVVNSKVGEMFLGLIAHMVSDKTNSNERHVISLLEKSKIFKDNYNLNNTLNIGMEKHPEQYFSGII